MIDDKHENGFESNLAKTLNEICKFACTIPGIQHSGFVRFDHNQETGYVAAQCPAIPGLHNQKVQLNGVPAEEDLLQSDEPLVINDVAGAEQLGEVRELLLRFNIQSICIVKVKIHGNAIGSFSFDSIGRKREFNARDIALCKSFAELASSKIEQTTQDEWLKAFHRATAALNVEKEAAPLLKSIIEQAEDLFKAETVGLYLRHPDASGKDSLHLVASSTEELTGRTLKKGEGMAWQLIMSNEPYMRTSDYENYEHKADTFEGKFGSVLEVPLLRQQERIGVLYLSDERGRTFTKSDADRLQLYAASALSAIEHCNLIARMMDLSIASAEMSGSTDSETLSAKLRGIARNATIILNAEMCGVFFRESDSETLVLKASFGHADDAPNTGRRFKIKDEPRSGLTGALAARFIASHANRFLETPPRGKDERPIVSLCGHELLDDPAVKSGEKDATPGGTCHSLLAVPLIHKRNGTELVLGMLRISNKKGFDGKPGNLVCFNDEDKLLLRVFTETAVVSLESAILADKKLELLEDLLQKLNLSEEREKNLKELALYDLKAGIFIHNQDELVHELKKKIEEFEKIVHENWPAKDAEANIASWASEIAAMSRELQEFYQGTRREMQKVRVSLQELAKMLQSQVLCKSGVKKQVIIGKSKDMVEVDIALVGHVFKVFCDNAVDAMEGVRREKELKIYLSSKDGWCSIRFSDTGTGMNPEVWQQIADWRSPRLDTWKQRKGLRSAFLAITEFGGTITMLSTGNQGTMFEIKLPLANTPPTELSQL